MLTHDSEAFVEQIVVPLEDKRVARRRQEISKAQVEIMREALQLRMLEQVLAGLEREAAAGEKPPGDRKRLGRRGSRDLDPAHVRSQLDALRAKHAAKKERESQLEQQASAREAEPVTARLYRLHSLTSHSTYSEEQYQELEVKQRDTPVRVADAEGQTWWWFADRFWWDDEHLRAPEVAEVVHQIDRELARRTDSSRRSLAIASDEQPASRKRATPVIPEIVRRAVWDRDRGRCVECGTDEDVSYDLIVPVSNGGSVSTHNVELRCSSCL